MIELLPPSGPPPKGLDTSASDALASACSASRWLKQLSAVPSAASIVASISSAGERSLDRKASTSELASPVHGASVMMQT